jgi:hypothetical protein
LRPHGWALARILLVADVSPDGGYIKMLAGRWSLRSQAEMALLSIFTHNLDCNRLEEVQDRYAIAVLKFHRRQDVNLFRFPPEDVVAYGWLRWSFENLDRTAKLQHNFGKCTTVLTVLPMS